MRTIQISTEVFAKIWGQRSSGEEDENAILERLLGVKENTPTQKALGPKRLNAGGLGALLWRQDVREALCELGGEAHLREIYAAVRSLRRAAGRSVPLNLEAIVRRELEYNSSDAAGYQHKRDWFRSVKGIGAGVWALRDDAKP